MAAMRRSKSTPDSSAPSTSSEEPKTPTASNLIRVFKLQERLKALGKEGDFKATHVHVVGAGTMGGDIAAWCALRGLTVAANPGIAWGAIRVTYTSGPGSVGSGRDGGGRG